jgi:hypothetical protein
VLHRCLRLSVAVEGVLPWPRDGAGSTLCCVAQFYAAMHKAQAGVQGRSPAVALANALNIVHALPPFEGPRRSLRHDGAALPRRGRIIRPVLVIENKLPKNFRVIVIAHAFAPPWSEARFRGDERTIAHVPILGNKMSNYLPRSSDSRSNSRAFPKWAARSLGRFRGTKANKHRAYGLSGAVRHG